MTLGVYAGIGAAVGAASGAAEVGKKEASSLAVSAATHLNVLIDQLQKSTDERAQRATWLLYGAAGAIAGT